MTTTDYNNNNNVYMNDSATMTILMLRLTYRNVIYNSSWQPCKANAS